MKIMQPTLPFSFFYKCFELKCSKTNKSAYFFFWIKKKSRTLILNGTHGKTMLNQSTVSIFYEFHDQGDGKKIIIRGQLWGHNDTPFAPSGSQSPGVGRPQGLFGDFSY
jgi:hypothetical protein